MLSIYPSLFVCQPAPPSPLPKATKKPAAKPASKPAASAKPKAAPRKVKAVSVSESEEEDEFDSDDLMSVGESASSQVSRKKDGMEKLCRRSGY